MHHIFHSMHLPPTDFPDEMYITVYTVEIRDVDPSGSAFVLQDPKNNYFAGPKENHKTLVPYMKVTCLFLVVLFLRAGQAS